MLINSWSLALMICSAAAILLIGGATRTALRILRHWAPATDSARQIDLENSTWLAALLIRYGLLLHLVAFLLLILAADSFAQVLVGAMCATGAFLANSYGVPSLLVKLFSIFAYGLWLILHHLDIRSEHLPLTKWKFTYLLFLVPLLVFDTTLLFLYLVNLTPDIITSCCGVVFGSTAGDGRTLVGPLPVFPLMAGFYGLAALLMVLAILRLRHVGQPLPTTQPMVDILLLGCCLIFFPLALMTITTVISPYIYALPTHRCPFDLLNKEYGYIGLSIYFLLFGATFGGISGAVAGLTQNLPGMLAPSQQLRRQGLTLLLIFLPTFLLLVSWYPASYLLKGGE